MKRVVIFFALLTVAMGAGAQKFEPNTKWPYLYEDFQQGTIFFQDNQKNSSTELNVHLLGNVLHYLGKDGKIYQSDDKNVMRVEIGSDAYWVRCYKRSTTVASSPLLSTTSSSLTDNRWKPQRKA